MKASLLAPLLCALLQPALSATPQDEGRRLGRGQRIASGGEAARELSSVTARLIGFDGEPVRGEALSVLVSTENGAEHHARHAYAATGADGRFTVFVTEAWAAGASRSLVVTRTRDRRVDENPLEVAQATLDLSRPLAGGGTDLGDLRLRRGWLTPESPAEFLEAGFQRLVDHRQDRTFRRPQLERLLTEMVRRGGERYERLLEAHLAFQIASVALCRGAESESELEILTALRRLQGRPDPLRVSVATERGLIEAVFPEVPNLVVTLENVDAGGCSFRMQRHGEYRVEGVDADGAPLRIQPLVRRNGGGLRSVGPFHPGETWSPGGMPIALHMDLPTKPTQWRVRVLHHDQEKIAHADSVRTLVCSASPELTVRWLPRTVRVDAAAQAEIERWIAELNASSPVPITFCAQLRANGWIDDPRTPQQKLYEAGERALPALIDSLDLHAGDLRRRAWILGLLFDITGLHGPLVHPAAFGAWVERGLQWNCDGAPVDETVRWKGHEPSPEEQVRLVERWRALASMLVVER